MRSEVCASPHLPPSPVHGTDQVPSNHLLNNGGRGFQSPSFPSVSGFLDNHTEEDPSQLVLVPGLFSAVQQDSRSHTSGEKAGLKVSRVGELSLDGALAPVHRAEGRGDEPVQRGPSGSCDPHCDSDPTHY